MGDRQFKETHEGCIKATFFAGRYALGQKVAHKQLCLLLQEPFGAIVACGPF